MVLDPPQILMKAIFTSILELSCPWEESEHQISGTVCPGPMNVSSRCHYAHLSGKTGNVVRRPALPSPLPPQPFFGPSTVFSTSSPNFHSVSPWPTEPDLWVVAHQKEHTETPVENKTPSFSGERRWLTGQAAYAP